jgi:hypothetical protein
VTPICDHHSFFLEARYQRVCAACQKAKSFHAHHVVYEQEIRRRLGVKKKDPKLYDTRNALRLCDERGGNCHARYHFDHSLVPTARLTDENIAYAFELLGLYGADYLRDKYDDSAADPRILKLELEMAA